ncbi:hemolysin III family protein [Jatrophihabitans endophyticus]|uniref:PAQR family membrane homeostasis protein TrhA n=1 Tax=Jatrophihabitans endophyticus TaxID=1206085 RepID=UPI0026EEE7E1|nr:hemolysin III family protein [Jatrophihabitans endophyticus]
MGSSETGSATMSPAPTPTEPTTGELLVAAVAEIKPRLRGWLHTYAAAVSLSSGAALIAVAAALRGGVAATVTAVYCVTVTLLFGTSALYHRRSWGPAGHRVMKRLDHSMIFVFIAGTYTPIAVLTLSGAAMVGVLAGVWAGAAVGVLLQLWWPTHPRWLSAPCYLALGWVAAFVFPGLLHTGGVAAFALIAVGGLIYTYGAVVYATKRPDPWPGTFGFHEVFHLCTVVAALCHYVAIWFAVFAR